MRTGSNLNGLLPALFSIIGSGYRNYIVVLSLCRQVEFYMHSLYISGDFITAYVFVIFLLLLPLRKLPLTFLTFIVSDYIRQETAGDSFNGILWNI